MNLTSSRKKWTNQSPPKGGKDHSSPKKTNFSSPREMVCRSDHEGKNNVQKSKLMKFSMGASSSYNSASESKKAPSLIPRSKSRRRAAKENLLRLQETAEVEVQRTAEEASPCKRKEKGASGSPDVKVTDSASLSLKSCESFEVRQSYSESSYKDAREQVSQEPKVSEDPKAKKQKKKEKQKEKQEEEREAERQEKAIRNLYETIMHSEGFMFETLTEVATKRKSVKKVRSEHRGVKERRVSSDREEGNFDSVQEYYESTTREISDIWRNALGLIASVKEHTLKYVVENNKKIDKEQLTLEAEMLQLAVDFAVTYSKLKTDFLLRGVRKRLEVKEMEKSELESFMDSKTFAALYNDEDLAAMAHTVEELHRSILKGVDAAL